MNEEEQIIYDKLKEFPNEKIGFDLSIDEEGIIMKYILNDLCLSLVYNAYFLDETMISNEFGKKLFDMVTEKCNEKRNNEYKDTLKKLYKIVLEKIK